MKNQFNLAVKTPCSEKFETFKKTQKGGFCNSCNKEVIDFTKMTTYEIVNYFKKNNHNTCGQFMKHQLSSPPQKLPKRKLSFFGGIGLAFFSFFTFGTLQAQKKSSNKEIKQLKKDFFIKGIVSDESGPLPGVSILLQGTNKGTQTDFDGRFKFPIVLKKDDVLIFSYLGFETKKITIDGKHSNKNITLNVNFKNESYVLMGAVEVKKVYKSKKKS
ncbi:carboxypeptidase-like regulatory domain-containing protein [Polaribacter sp. MSW13]|uniref:Carboxypeptidase-like regulatory domain-containing protein n=1 Tax=Polaribacter marinus TaxID=2916838 RepID=A0A9X2AKI7_9FLAO|nr:carboxypeptidase-like regulatory domain-containing protein [Polaribacter marinus]MCI2230112.1 carboxypeptidase-like regulatory domain-containing protein [Polaribacter marinus]